MPWEQMWQRQSGRLCGPQAIERPGERRPARRIRRFAKTQKSCWGPKKDIDIQLLLAMVGSKRMTISNFGISVPCRQHEIQGKAMQRIDERRLEEDVAYRPRRLT